MYALKYVVLNVGVRFTKLLNEHFYFLTLAVAYAVADVCVVIRKAASALYKMQIIIIAPFNYVVLAYAIHRAYKLHSLKIS